MTRQFTRLFTGQTPIAECRQPLLSRITDARIRSGQTQCSSVLAHNELLMRSDFQIRTRESCAEKDESLSAILRKVGHSVACIELARFEKSAGASEASPLMADRWKFNSGSVRGVPDMLIFSDRQFANGSVWQVQSHAMMFGTHLHRGYRIDENRSTSYAA